MKTNLIKYSAVVLTAVWGLVGCVAPMASEDDSFRIETETGGSLSFRRVTAKKTDEGLVVAGRVSSRCELPVAGNDVLVSLKDEGGTLIDQKTVSSFPRSTTGRAQSPESRFIVQFDGVPPGRLVVEVESAK